MIANSFIINQVVQWFAEVIKKIFREETVISKGIPLQICDVFLQELNKVDGEEISS